VDKRWKKQQVLQESGADRGGCIVFSCFDNIVLARKIEAAHAVAEGAAKLLFSKAFAVLLEAAALPAITRFQLAFVQPLHELLVYM